MQAYLPLPTRQTCRSRKRGGPGSVATTSRTSCTTGASISASSSTRPVSRSRPMAQRPTSTVPTMPITGSSQAAP